RRRTQRAPADAKLPRGVRAALDLGGQGPLRRPAAVRVQAAGAGRVPGARAGLPRPVRARAGDELGDAALGRDQRPATLSQAGRQAVRDQDGALLALPGERSEREARVNGSTLVTGPEPVPEPFESSFA